MTDDRGVHDVLIVGAGFAGMYLLHRQRAAGFDVLAVEAAPEVGGGTLRLRARF